MSTSEECPSSTVCQKSCRLIDLWRMERNQHIVEANKLGQSSTFAKLLKSIAEGDDELIEAAQVGCPGPSLTGKCNSNSVHASKKLRMGMYE